MELTTVMEDLQHFAENPLVGLAIRMRYKHVDISTRGLSSAVGATRHRNQAWVYGLGSIL